MRSALSILRSSSSLLGKVLKISLLGKGLCRNRPHLHTAQHSTTYTCLSVLSHANLPPAINRTIAQPHTCVHRRSRPTPAALAPFNWYASDTHPYANTSLLAHFPPDLVEALAQQAWQHQQVIVMDPHVVSVSHKLFYNLLHETLQAAHANTAARMNVR